MIDMAKARGLKGCTFKKGDLESLGEFTDLADEVLLIGLIDYLDDPQEGLRALGSCVKHGGSIILSFRNKFSIPFFLRETSKKIWRRLKGASAETERAFDADVLENAFSSRRDLVPFLKSVGFTSFDVQFLDASPIFFRVNLPKWLWKVLFVVDRIFSRRFLSVFAASGVLKATKK
jgi:SAM-dependent methyltransferase